MLRISTEAGEDCIVLRVEGSLRDPWVAELEGVWRTHADGPKLTVVELAEVSYVDDAAKALLHEMCQAGTELRANGPLMKAVVNEIARPAFATHAD